MVYLLMYLCCKIDIDNVHCQLTYLLFMKVSYKLSLLFALSTVLLCCVVSYLADSNCTSVCHTTRVTACGCGEVLSLPKMPNLMLSSSSIETSTSNVSSKNRAAVFPSWWKTG